MPSESLIQRYRNAALSLLPPGRALAKSLGLNPAALLEALGVEWARVHEDADAFYEGCFPNGSEDYLPDWEAALGLPGKCVGYAGSVAERQGAVIAKLRGRTSHAQAAFEAAAEALGYTDLEFVRYPPLTAGFVAGQAAYGDEWAHVVRVFVPVNSQTADDTLVCLFVDELRRSHGFIDVILEGPMGAEREAKQNYYNASPLSASGVVADLAAVSIRYAGHVSIQCKIAKADGSAPTDTPVGVWELWVAADGQNFEQFTNAAIVNELAKIAPNGNNVVKAFAVFDGMPGTSFKVRYNRSSGGGTDATTTVHITTW